MEQTGSATSAGADGGKVKTFQGRKSPGLAQSRWEKMPMSHRKTQQAFCFWLHCPRSRKASAPLTRTAQTQQQSVEQSSLAGVPAFPAFLFSLGSSSTKAMAKAQ